MEHDYKKIGEEIRNTGFFSEYLPECFKLNEKAFSKIPGKDCDLIKPICFTMSKFNLNDSRRNIYIPEIGSYAVVHEFVKNNDIIKELTEFIDKNSASFSPVVMEDGSIMRHDQSYDCGKVLRGEVSSSYIENITNKIIKSAGAKKILKLDIANCFSSIYTHLLPSILLGYEKAEENYKKAISCTKEVDELYEKYKNLDKIIRRQNRNQTNGLLVGPILSKLIVEALLTRIDIELKEEEIKFSRYVDDYEVYLFEDNEKKIINSFVSVLKKYDLSINSEKTQVLDFPYYIVENYDRIINLYREGKVEDYDLIKLFNDFLLLEKSGNKGAVRYLIKSLEKNPKGIANNMLLDSYLLSVIANNDRALTKACSLIIKNHIESDLEENYIIRIRKMIVEHLMDGHDLEVIWLLYILIETKNIKSNDDIISDLIKSRNELAQIMLLRKRLLSDEEKQEIIKKAESWILKYELYMEDLIGEDDLGLNKNKGMYSKMKRNGIHFCY